MDTKQELLKLVEKHLDVPALVSEALAQVAKPALEEIVADSSNSFDDVALAALYPALVPVVEAQLRKLWDKVDGEVSA